MAQAQNPHAAMHGKSAMQILQKDLAAVGSSIMLLLVHLYEIGKEIFHIPTEVIQGFQKAYKERTQRPVNLDLLKKQTVPNLKDAIDQARTDRVCFRINPGHHFHTLRDREKGMQ